MKQLSQVLDGVWYTLDEMWLLFEIATETVGSQYLQGAEEYEVTQLAKEIITVYWLYLERASIYSSNSSLRRVSGNLALACHKKEATS